MDAESYDEQVVAQFLPIRNKTSDYVGEGVEFSLHKHRENLAMAKKPTRITSTSVMLSLKLKLKQFIIMNSKTP